MLFDVGPLYMTASRVLFLGLVPLLLWKFASGDIDRLRAPDVFIGLFILWVGLSIARNNPEALVTFVGSNALAFLGGYLTARYSIRSAQEMLDVFRFVTLCILVLLPFAIYESITTHMVIPPLIDAIPGVFSRTDVNYDRRLGLDRAQVTFSHPIHWGTFASLGFAFVMTGFRSFWSRKKRLLVGALVALACFLSVSSGPFLALAAQGALLLYWLILRRTAHYWTALWVFGGLIYLIAELLSDRPAFYAISSRLAFNSYTANLRMTLLEYGIVQIGKTPFLGIGYNSWDLPEWMSGSLDNYWLMTALVYGVPALMFLAGAFAWPMIAAGRRNFDAVPLLADLRRAWEICMFSLILTLATVAVWGEMASMVFFIIGAGVFFTHASETPADEAKTEAGPGTPDRRLVYTRFPQRPGGDARRAEGRAAGPEKGLR